MVAITGACLTWFLATMLRSCLCDSEGADRLTVARTQYPFIHYSLGSQTHIDNRPAPQAAMHARISHPCPCGRANSRWAGPNIWRLAEIAGSVLVRGRRASSADRWPQLIDIVKPLLLPLVDVDVQINGERDKVPGAWQQFITPILDSNININH
ncbi:hypothetical protein BD309DRAFT_652108 [Dichomitus squalens]|nr:hypothetical protein BD309DRAFT_652108 [Dichomitus squalens]